MTWHEIVNDLVGGEPVTVTFCPLCNTAIVFERRMGDTVNSFGVSGLLRYSDLIMYDRATDSWWQQVTGEAIVGELTGTRLTYRSPPPSSPGPTSGTPTPTARSSPGKPASPASMAATPTPATTTSTPRPSYSIGPEDGRLRPVERVATVEVGWRVGGLPLPKAGGEPRGPRRP